MYVYTVSYDLHEARDGENDKVREAIESLGHSAWILGSSWVVASEKVAGVLKQDVIRRLTPGMRGRFSIFISSIGVAENGGPNVDFEGLENNTVSALEDVMGSWTSR